MPKNALRWLRLDNAAKIYPAARSRTWSNVYRVSVMLTQDVDKTLLQRALDQTVVRFPSIAARLRKGAFWYYLEQIENAPYIMEESSYPLTPMYKKDIRTCAFRVIIYGKRIALEVFHALTDGAGAMVFLKTLTAQYLHEKYGITVSAGHGVLDVGQPAQPEELEDSFLKYAGKVSATPREKNAWQLKGTREADGFLHITCFRLETRTVLDAAHSYGVSVTAFLTAVLMQALQQLQEEIMPVAALRKPIRIQIPVNLRSLFPSRTLRNFSFFTTPELDPRLGSYSFREICNVVKHRMGLDITPKEMQCRISSNVGMERMLLIRLMPLFVKNFVMKTAFRMVGERKCCLSISNLGQIAVPEEMKSYVNRFDFILSPQSQAPYNCGVISYQGILNINFTRNTREPELEAAFFRVLQQLQLPVTVESNG